MRARAIISCAIAAGLALAGAAAQAGTDYEAKLAELLEGRVAGAPVDCIPHDSHGAGSLTIVDRTAVIYRRGDTIYVNRTANPKNLDWNDVLVVERFSGSRLCRQDRIFTHDRGGFGRTGVVFLERFVPYKKAG